MQLYTLASGSSGNSTLCIQGNTCLLVDAGISCRKITTRLAKIGRSPEKLNDILVTHTHSDHISGLNVLPKKPAYPRLRHPGSGAGAAPPRPQSPAGAAVHTGAGGGDRRRRADRPSLCNHSRLPRERGLPPLRRRTPGGGGHRPGLVGPGGAGGAGRGKSGPGGGKPRRGMAPFRPVSPALQARILGDHGHLSNEMGGALAVRLARSGTDTLILGHLSKENNTPEKACSVVSAMLERAGCTHTRLYVAPRDDLAGPFEA
ncbi:MAG: MBL fold metallo-hydrolase [Clostridiales bacterium]|nr:MBL fold metallo-hydrolase [Clostridiales bacterium]